MKQKLLDILACPHCKSDLEYDKKHDQLICTVEGTIYPIRDGIPVLLDDGVETVVMEQEE